MTGFAVAVTFLAITHVFPISARNPGPLLQRKSHLDVTPEEWESLQRGFEVLRQRSEDDPTSYLYQANIHGYRDYSKDPPRWDGKHWHQCQHGHYFFLPWHRMYLYCFEKILRAASGDPNLTIPYWDYFSDEGRAFPAQFLSATNNSLYVPERCMSTAKIPENYVDVGPALSKFRFVGDVQGDDDRKLNAICHSFGGRKLNQPNSFDTNEYGALERIPHNMVHNWIGGLMGDNCRASQDPIFWLHHAQIDRVWDTWVKTHGQNPTDQTWLNKKFTFYDEHGQEVSMTVLSVLDTEELGYEYDKLVIEDEEDDEGIVRRCVVILHHVDVLANNYYNNNLTTPHNVRIGNEENPVIRLNSLHTPDEPIPSYSYSIQLTLVSILHSTMFRVCLDLDGQSCTDDNLVADFVISNTNCGYGDASTRTLTFEDPIVRCFDATEAVKKYFTAHNTKSLPDTIDIRIELQGRQGLPANDKDVCTVSRTRFPADSTNEWMRISHAQIVRFTEGHGSHPNGHGTSPPLNWVHVFLGVGVGCGLLVVLGLGYCCFKRCDHGERASGNRDRLLRNPTDGVSIQYVNERRV